VKAQRLRRRGSVHPALNIGHGRRWPAGPCAREYDKCVAGDISGAGDFSPVSSWTSPRRSTLLLVGPAGLVPAIVEGAATVSLLGVEQRPLKPEEITFAMRLFGGSLDYDRIVLTNLTHPTDPGRRFTFPSISKSITVNLGQAPFDKPAEYTNADYPAPGQLFIHELVYAWLFTHHSRFDMLCNYAENYVYFSGSDRLLDPSWQGRAWNSFKVEQQANIVDDWFEAHQPTPSEPDKLESFEALNDPAFRFIRDDIRNQIP
jgi:hypothetical protein